MKTFSSRMGVNSGIGAQLQQLAFILNLGLLTNRRFVCLSDRAFCHRSGLDVFDVMGLGNAFERLEVKPNDSREILLSDTFLGIRDTDTSVENKTLINNIEGNSATEHISFNFKDWSLLKNLRRLRPDLFSMAVYRELYNTDLIVDKLNQRIDRYLIHLRLGDVASLETPAGTVSCWGVKGVSNEPSVLQMKDEASYPPVNFDKLRELVQGLLNLSEDTSVCVVSDGFSRSIERVNKFKDKLGLTDVDIDFIKNKYQDSYIIEALGANCQERVEFIIGESEDKTLSVIQQIQMSAAVIHGAGSFVSTILSVFVRKNKKLRRYNYLNKETAAIISNEARYVNLYNSLG